MSQTAFAGPPVIVVGGGPVGLSLAGDLGLRGVPCILLEQSDGSIVQPKMDGVNVRTMEFCRRWGIRDEVRNCDYPAEYPQDMVYLTSFGGYELGREAFLTPSGGAEERQLAASPETRVRCPQNLFDPILRDFAQSLDLVELRYRHRFVAFEDTGEAVSVEVENLETGRTERLQGSYLVGCDGGASSVREQLGIPMEGSGALTFTTNVIFRCEGLQGLHDKRLGYRHIFIGPEGTWATCVAINGRDQWRLSIIGSGEKQRLSDEDIRAAIDRALGFDVPYEVLSVVHWVRRELIARHYGGGRVFIAGDAAHVMSPTGGFGMNTGIADAVDLSWKLAARIQGWGGEGLLTSYEAERRPVAIRAAREASGNLVRTLSPGANPKLLERTYEGALERYEVGRRYSATMLREWYKLGIDLGYIYADSPICWPASDPMRNEDVATAAPTSSLVRELHKLAIHKAEGYVVDPGWAELPPEDVMVYRPVATAGARAPHAWLKDRRSTLDLYGESFTLLVLGGDPARAESARAHAAAVGLPLAVVSCDEPEVLKLYASSLVLVRPDGHIAFAGQDWPPEGVEALLDHVRGVVVTSTTTDGSRRAAIEQV